MKALLIDNGTSYLPELKKLLSRYRITLARWDSVTTKRISAFDLIVLSGGHTVSPEARKAFRKEIALIRNSKVPVVGICLGCELIVKAFGGYLHRRRRKIKGIRTIKMNLSGKGYEFQVFENHRREIKTLPPDFMKLALSGSGIEIIRHRNKQIYGVQFHPEMFPKKTDGTKIFKILLKEAFLK